MLAFECNLGVIIRACLHKIVLLLAIVSGGGGYFCGGGKAGSAVGHYGCVRGVEGEGFDDGCIELHFGVCESADCSLHLEVDIVGGRLEVSLIGDHDVIAPVLIALHKPS